MRFDPCLTVDRKSRKSNILNSLLLLLCLCFAPLEAEVASVKAMGMGYTGVAYPQDALAGAYNPAGMGWIGNRFDIGVTGKMYNGAMVISGNQTLSAEHPINGIFNPFRQKYFVSGDVGFNQQFSAWDFPFTLGLIGYERDFWHTNYKQHEFFLFGSSPIQFSYENYVVAPVFAIQIDTHTIGVAINFEWSYVKVGGLQNFALEGLTRHPNSFTNNGGDNSWGITGAVGWQWRALDCFWVGISFQPQTPIKKFTRYEGFLVDGRLNSPQIFSAGFAFKPWQEMTFTFDYEIYSWRNVASMANNGEPELVDAILLDPTFLFGRPGGPGFGWRNQTALKFGVDWIFWNCFTVRAGYRFRNTPIRSSQTFLNMLTMNTVSHTATVGMSFEFADFHELSFYYAHGFDGHVNGDNQSIPSFFGAGRVNLSSHFNFVGLSYGWNW